MLATYNDLVALGAIPDSTQAYEKYGIRATRLLELASGQVCAYLGSTEAVLLATLTADQVTSLAAIVAECAASRLNVSAAPSTDPYASISGAPASVLLNKWHKAQLDELVGRSGSGSKSVVVERDEDTSLPSIEATDIELVYGVSVFDGGTWYPV